MFYQAFTDELEKLGVSRWRRKWPRLSRKARMRITGSETPELGKEKLQKTRERLFAPAGPESRVPEPRGEQLRRRVEKMYPASPDVALAATMRGPVSTIRKGKPQIALPKKSFFQSFLSPEEARAIRITSPAHELAEVAGLKRHPEVLSPGYRKRIQAGKALPHAGIGPLLAEQQASYGSPRLQRTRMELRAKTKPEGEALRTMKEYGWTPHRLLPKRPGQKGKMERQITRRLVGAS